MEVISAISKGASHKLLNIRTCFVYGLMVVMHGSLVAKSKVCDSTLYGTTEGCESKSGLRIRLLDVIAVALSLPFLHLRFPVVGELELNRFS